MCAGACACAVLFLWLTVERLSEAGVSMPLPLPVPDPLVLSLPLSVRLPVLVLLPLSVSVSVPLSLSLCHSSCRPPFAVSARISRWVHRRRTATSRPKRRALSSALANQMSLRYVATKQRVALVFRQSTHARSPRSTRAEPPTVRGRGRTHGQRQMREYLIRLV